MGRLATAVVMCIIFVGGIFTGGWLGVHGKTNTFNLEVDHSFGPLPLVAQGDTIHWLDPYNLTAQGAPKSVSDIYFTGKTPCTIDPYGSGLCSINVVSGNYKYQCRFCGDPKIPVQPGTGPGGNGVTGGDGNDVAFDLKVNAAPESFGLRLARWFVATFFPTNLPSGTPVHKPDYPQPVFTPPPTVEAYFDCDTNYALAIKDPKTWFPPANMPLALGTAIDWASQGGPTKFTVQDAPNSTDLTEACTTAPPFQSNLTGTSDTCVLKPSYPRASVRYTILDTSSAAKKCVAPPAGFILPVTGGTLPGLAR